jgi:hypothetical protein
MYAFLRGLLCVFLFFTRSDAHAQDTASTCKVLMEAIKGEYTGECKKGFAHGKGESKGMWRYAGNFKNGLPNGKGILYATTYFFDGNFLDGLKEGKGEMHYTRPNETDSIIKGYWSGDEYRGKSYITYVTDAVPKFDRVEISPTAESGNRITIEIATTSSANGGFSSQSVSIFLTELMSVKLRSLLKLVNSFDSPLKSTTVFEITEFPITLRGVLSNGQNFNLELYKSANWTLRIFINK